MNKTELIKMRENRQRKKVKHNELQLPKLENCQKNYIENTKYSSFMKERTR